MYYNIERDIYQTLFDSTLKILKDNSAGSMNRPPGPLGVESSGERVKNDPLKIIALHVLAQAMCKHGASSEEGLKYFISEIQKHEKA